VRKNIIGMTAMVLFLAMLVPGVFATPVITINSPLNQTYYTNQILVNITQVEANPEMMWYSFPQGDWSMFRENLNRTGYTINFNPPELVQLWNFTTGGNFYYSSPVVANGVVYIGNFDQKLYAIYLNGTQKWNYTTGGNLRASTAAVAEGVVYIGSYDNKLYAVYTNGTFKWSFTTGDSISSSPAVADGVVYVGSADGNLYAVYENGTQKWSYDTGGSIYFSSPAVVDGVIYTGSNSDRLYAIYENGTQKWNFTTGDNIHSTPTVVDGVVYVGSNDFKLYAIYTNGTQKWNYTAGNEFEVTSPAVYDGAVYIGNSDWNLYSIYTNGTLKWTHWLNQGIFSSPSISDGVVYVGSNDDKLYAIYTNGTEKWNFATGGDVSGSPAISNGMVFIGSDDDNLYAFGDGSSTNSLERTINLEYGTHELEVYSRNTSGDYNTSTIVFTLSPTYTCNDCSSCSGYLQNSSSGDIIQLNQDIIDQVGSCVDFINDNVTFDCQGYLIDGDNAGQDPDNGINASGDNIVIKNCRIDGRFEEFYGGLLSIVNSDNATVMNVTSLGGASRTSVYTSGLTNSSFNDVTTNGRFDVSCSYCHFDGGSHENTGNPSLDLSGNFNVFENSIVRGTSNLLSGNDWLFRNVTFHTSTYAFRWVSTRNNLTIDSCNFSGNTYGFHSTQPVQSNLTIMNSNFSGNSYGIYVTNPYANSDWLIYNNYFNNTEDVLISHPTFLFAIDWNTTEQAGPNIIGGSDIGGNYWAGSTLWDRDGDGIAESALNLTAEYPNVNGDQMDYLPLTNNQDLYPPDLVIALPTNTTYLTINISLNYTAFDNQSGVDSCFYSLNGSANTSILGCNNITIPLVDGFFYLQVYVNDTAGWVTEEGIYFTIDTTPPSITIHSPSAGVEYNSLPITLAVSANEAVDTWYYNINGTNVTFTPNTTLPITDIGDHNLDVWVNDSVGFWGKSSVAFSYRPFFFAYSPEFLIIPIVLALIAVSLVVQTLLNEKRELDLNRIVLSAVLMIISVAMIGVMFAVTV